MDHREKKRLLDAAEWGKIYPRLLAFATGRARSDDMGKDLAQNAIANVYDVDSTWDPEKQPDLLRHLMSLVNSDLWARRTSAASKLNRSIETSKQTRKLARAVEDKSAFSERRAEEHDLLTRRVQLLRERLVKDGDVVRLGNRRGETRLHARLFAGLRRGVLISEGVWPAAAFLDGKGINVLTGDDVVAPFGGAAFHDNRVWLRPA